VELLLFALDDDLAAGAAGAGVDAVVVDLERRGKEGRQSGFDTDVTAHTLDDVARVRDLTTLPLVVRVDGPGPGLAGRLADAVAAGADEALVPMVADAAAAADCLRAAPSDLPVGVLVERTTAVADAARIGALPLARVYVGLMDLMVERGAASPFTPLVDGTVATVRAATQQVFGVAGLTAPGFGAPVPARLLAGELVRLGTDFTFLRRSFHHAVGDLGLPVAVAAVRTMLAELTRRDSAAVASDRRELERALVGTAAP
jgi:hypothetical protein